MSIRNEYIDFKNLDEAYPIAMSLDRAIYKPIHVGEYGFTTTEETESKIFKAIINESTGVEVNIPSVGWRIVQHPDFFVGVIDRIKKAKLDGKGQFVIMRGGNKVKMNVLFDDIEKIPEPGFGDNIQIGGQFINSYMGDASASGRAYYMRISCFNQFDISNVIPEAKFARIHRAEDDVRILEDVLGRIDNYIINLLGSGVQFKTVMNNAIDKKVAFDSKMQVVKTFIDFTGTTKHGRGIAEILMDESESEKLEFSQWDMYNAITQYATHNVTSENIRENILRKGESKLLKPRSIIIPAIMNEENAVEVSTV